MAAAKRNAGVRSCARPLDQRFFSSLLFFSSSFSSSSLFFLPFISFFRRSIDTDHLFWIIFTGVRASPPPSPPLAKKWEFTRTGAWLSGKFCREPTTSANEHDTKKRIRPCNRAIFVAPSTWRKKEGSVCIYIYVFYIYIYVYSVASVDVAAPFSRLCKKCGTSIVPIRHRCPMKRCKRCSPGVSWLFPPRLPFLPLPF